MIALISQNAKVNKNNLALLEKIFKLAESFITEEMNHLITDETYSKKILDDPYPIEQIIKKCFIDYIADAKDTKYVINDYYNYNNQLKDSLDTYDTFPKWLKDKYNSDNAKTHEYDKYRRDIRNAYEKDKKLQLEHIKFLAQKNISDDSINI